MNIAYIIKKNKDRGLPILLFFISALACRIISVYILPELFADSRQSIWLQLCEGIGPTVGTLAVMYFFRRKLFCSITGNSLKRSIACIVIPILLLLVFDRMNGVKTSLILCGCVLYAFLEEVGWRGYLTGELAEWGQLKRIMTITAFWFFWHVNFPLGVNGLVFVVILLLSSWGLDQLARDTHSLILCACVHGIFNLFKHNNGVLNNYITISILTVSIISWFIIWYYPINKKHPTQ
jgi:membrane protease YdiL (CAAX protease family)